MNFRIEPDRSYDLSLAKLMNRFEQQFRCLTEEKVISSIVCSNSEGVSISSCQRFSINTVFNNTGRKVVLSSSQKCLAALKSLISSELEYESQGIHPSSCPSAPSQNGKKYVFEDFDDSKGDAGSTQSIVSRDVLLRIRQRLESKAPTLKVNLKALQTTRKSVLIRDESKVKRFFTEKFSLQIEVLNNLEDKKNSKVFIAECKIENIETLADSLIDEVVNWLKISTLPEYKCENRIFNSVFTANAMSEMFRYLANSIQTSKCTSKTSTLMNCIGQKLFGEHVNIREVPTISGSVHNAPFDSEGSLTVERGIVKNGVLVSLLTDKNFANSSAESSTGNADGLSNWVVEVPVSASKKKGTFLWISELLAGGFNPLTGKLNQRFNGYIETDGVKTFKITNATFNTDIKRFFGQIDEYVHGGLNTKDIRTSDCYCGKIKLDD